MSSIHDVAKKAGVSTATVSRTFSAPNLLNAATQERVLEAARLLDYRPRHLRTAQERKRKTAPTSSRSIGFEFFAAAPSDTLLSNNFYAPVLAGAEAEASALGLHLLLHTTDRHSLSLELPRMVTERAVEGMLLVGTADPAILQTFTPHVPSIVLVDNRDTTGTYESMLSDGFGGAFAAVNYLRELGHTRIGFLSGEVGIATFEDRLHGYQAALLKAGLTPDPALILDGSFGDGNMAQLSKLLTSAQKPTALVAANDYHALLAMRLCREIGVSIPQDLSLIGFDDVSFSEHTDPPLTTMHVNKEGMGRVAVRRLVARIEAATDNSIPLLPVHNQIPVSLVVRGSCCNLYR